MKPLIQPNLSQASRAIVAGWTGRNRSHVHHHIKELEQIGVKPPSATPLFYEISTQLLTTDERIEVLGSESSGEVEPVVMFDGRRFFLGVGSDHTDRAMESMSVAHSKALCAKPIADQFWPWDAVSTHLDSLELRSWIWEGESPNEILYQEGTLIQLLPIPSLLEKPEIVRLVDSEEPFVLFCGTIPAIGGIRPARRMRFMLSDPIRHAEIEHTYDVTPLDIVS